MTGAVIFDRDGVLAEFDLAGAHRSLGALPFGLEQFGAHLRAWAPRARPIVDLESERAFWDSFWSQLGESQGWDEALRARLRRFEPHTALRAFTDARPALEEARQRGYRVGVLSNFTLLDLPTSLESLGLGGLVDVALSAARVGASKPRPEAYEAMARALGVAPAECLFVDDRPECVEGARRVGMRAWLLDRQGRSADGNRLRSLGDLFEAAGHRP